MAFEKVCFVHIDQIRKKLGISGVSTQVNSWLCKADDDKGYFGSQIDLLIVRKDKIINLCEIKYSDYEYRMDKKTYESLKRKEADLSLFTGNNDSIHPVLITCSGLVENDYSDCVQTLVTFEDLFQ